MYLAVRGFMHRYTHTRPTYTSTIFLLMSVFRLGSLIRFLSFSVMSGFTTYVPISAETGDPEPARHPNPSTHNIGIPAPRASTSACPS